MKFNSYSFKRLFSPASKFLLGIGLAGSLAGCQWGDEITSLVQPNPDDFWVLFSDTSTIISSTVRLDSVMTGGTDRLLVGRFEDPYFGPLQASTFLQLMSLSGVSVPDGAVYDSLELSLQYFRNTANRPYFYGDTTKAINLSVHALKENILDKSVFYNVSTTPFDPKPIGELKFFPRPYTGDVLHVRLTDTLGLKVFADAKANQLTSNDQWIALLKGMLLTAKSTDNGAVIGFQQIHDSTAINLHYHTTGLDGITRGVTSFKNSASNNAAYNQIIADRSKTQLSALPTTRRLALPSALSGEKTFIQDGTGIMTRIDIPYFRSLKDVKYSVANRAFLRVTPIRQSVTKTFTAPPEIYVYICGRNNELLGALTDLQGQPVKGQYINDLVNNTEFYSFDVTGYVTSLLNSNAEVNNGLVLVTSSLAVANQYPEASTEVSHGVRRLVIGSQKNTTDRGVKLELYYTTVKPQTK